MDPQCIDDPISLYIAEMDTIPAMSRSDQLERMRQVRAGGPAAEEAAKALIEANLPSVVAIALHETDQDDFAALAVTHAERAIAEAARI